MEKPAIGLFPKAFPLFMLSNDHCIFKFFTKLKVQIRYPLACTDQMQIEISNCFLSENYSVWCLQKFSSYIIFLNSFICKYGTNFKMTKKKA